MTYRLLTLALVAVLGSACSTGYSRVLFVTKTNLGLDIDKEPATVQLAIGRKEGGIAPSFEGRTPPLLASFRYDWNFLPISLFTSVSSTFGGGDAAWVLSKYFDDGVTTPGADAAQKTANTTNASVAMPTDGASVLCIKEEPAAASGLGSIAHLDGKIIRPFVFGTDTSLGLKLAWSGLTAQYPDTVRLGYVRKEMAWAPVSGRKVSGCELARREAGGSDKGTFEVVMPSFLATVDSGVTAKGPASGSLEYLQYFATGTAATNLAEKAAVRAAMVRRIDPAAGHRAEQNKILKELGPNARETLERKAHASVDSVKDEKLDDAWKLALQSHVVPEKDTSAFREKGTPEEKRAFLKERVKAATDEDLPNLLTFVVGLGRLK